jgi:hypothetical protein
MIPEKRHVLRHGDCYSEGVHGYDDEETEVRGWRTCPFPPTSRSRYARWLLDRRWRFQWARILRGVPKVRAYTAYCLHDGMRNVSECALVLVEQECPDWEVASNLDTYCEQLLECIDSAACSNPWHKTDPIVLGHTRRLVLWIHEIGDAYALGNVGDNHAVEYAVQEQLIHAAVFLELCARRWARPFLQPAPLRWARRWYLPLLNGDWLVDHLNVCAQHMRGSADSMLLPPADLEY